MKRILLLMLALCLFLTSPALAQRIDMDNAHVAFDYPDTWLVVSPQLCTTYAQLLADAGLDAQSLAADLRAQGIESRAYSPDFTQWLSVLTMTDDLSEEIYDIESVTDAQRKTLRTRAEGNRLFETTGYRAQDVEWQREGGVYWLYIHYTVTRRDQIVGRGLRYLTVRNGMYVVLDWQIASGRFGNKDLAAFRARLSDLSVTESVPEPVRTVKLDAAIPAETSTSALTITGTTTGGAMLVAEAPDALGVMQTLSVGTAKSGGAFSLLVELPEEGTYDITLTASADGMESASVTGRTVFSAKTLPVSLAGIPENGVVTSDTVKITGTTLAGVQFQLITPYGLTKKRAGNDGTFSFELTTADEGEYSYTLICDKDGYNQRRIAFTLTRVTTQAQEREKVKATAVKISYKNLQSCRDADQGQLMVLYGPVTRVSAAGDVHYVRMQFNKDAQGTWFNPVVIVAQEDMGVRVGDMMTVVVKVAGVFEEQDSAGNSIAVPRFELVFVDKVE